MASESNGFMTPTIVGEMPIVWQKRRDMEYLAEIKSVVVKNEILPETTIDKYLSTSPLFRLEKSQLIYDSDVIYSENLGAIQETIDKRIGALKN